jgi:hypothetical protein
MKDACANHCAIVYLTGTKSKCQKELETALKNQMPGSFTPSCEEDGSYSPKQCHRSATGYCWCVTKLGEKIVGTQLRFIEQNCSQSKTSSKRFDR